MSFRCMLGKWYLALTFHIIHRRIFGISMHQFPKDPVVQRKWVKFVQRHHANFHESSVTKYTSLCSAHFVESCYTQKISLDLGEHSKQNKVLIRGSIPTRDSVVPERTDILTGQRKCQVSCELNVSLINSYFLVLIRKFFYSVNRVISLLGWYKYFDGITRRQRIFDILRVSVCMNWNVPFWSQHGCLFFICVA